MALLSHFLFSSDPCSVCGLFAFHRRLAGDNRGHFATGQRGRGPWAVAITPRFRDPQPGDLDPLLAPQPRAWGYTCGLRSAPLQRAGRAIEQSRYAPRLRISWVIAASIHFARRFFCGYVNRCLTGRMVTCTNAITAGTASKISPIQNSKKIMMRNDSRLISVRVQ
jgi:hypothetical protein